MHIVPQMQKLAQIRHVPCALNVSACKADENIESVMSLMADEQQVRRIPIVDERGDHIGIVSQADIVLESGDGMKAEETVKEISRPYGKHSE